MSRPRAASPMNKPTRVPLFVVPSPIASLGKVTLFKHTWDDHILTGHPEMAGKIDAIQRTITNPTAVVISPTTGQHYIFVNHDEKVGSPLTAMVSISEAVVCTTFYNRSYRVLPTSGSVIWSR
jgi:hypothetical protein